MEALYCNHGALSLFARPSVSSPRLIPQPPRKLGFLHRKPTSVFSLRVRSSAAGYGILGPQTPTQVQETEKLKEELFKAIEAAEGSLDDKCLAIVASLEQLNLVPDLTARPDLIKGCLLGVKANYKENRRDGKKRYLGYSGALTTLGSVTFNAFKPIDLKIALYDTYQHISMESDDSYSIIIEFTIIDPLEKDAPLQGLIINRARFSVGGPNRLQVEFLSCGLKPRFPEKDLHAWLTLLKEPNPGMDENGYVVIPLPGPVKGWSDFLYMDDEIRIQKGNKGGVTVLQLLKEAIVSI